MINIISFKPIEQKDLKELDDAKRFVKPGELWYGYNIPLADIKDKLKVGFANITLYSETKTSFVIFYDDVILCASHVSINDLMQACKNSKYTLPSSDKTIMGYLDDVHKRKYLAVPINPYWDYQSHPIVLIKK